LVDLVGGLGEESRMLGGREEGKVAVKVVEVGEEARGGGLREDVEGGDHGVGEEPNVTVYGGRELGEPNGGHGEVGEGLKHGRLDFVVFEGTDYVLCGFGGDPLFDPLLGGRDAWEAGTQSFLKGKQQEGKEVEEAGVVRGKEVEGKAREGSGGGRRGMGRLRT
jgi:hypothetical protein